jgi:hypothetical protein
MYDNNHEEQNTLLHIIYTLVACRKRPQSDKDLQKLKSFCAFKISYLFDKSHYYEVKFFFWTLSIV